MNSHLMFGVLLNSMFLWKGLVQAGISSGFLGFLGADLNKHAGIGKFGCLKMRDPKILRFPTKIKLLQLFFGLHCFETHPFG